MATPTSDDDKEQRRLDGNDDDDDDEAELSISSDDINHDAPPPNAANIRRSLFTANAEQAAIDAKVQRFLGHSTNSYDAAVVSEFADNVRKTPLLMASSTLSDLPEDARSFIISRMTVPLPGPIETGITDANYESAIRRYAAIMKSTRVPADVRDVAACNLALQIQRLVRLSNTPYRASIETLDLVRDVVRRAPSMTRHGSPFALFSIDFAVAVQLANEASAASKRRRLNF